MNLTVAVWVEPGVEPGVEPCADWKPPEAERADVVLVVEADAGAAAATAVGSMPACPPKQRRRATAMATVMATRVAGPCPVPCGDGRSSVETSTGDLDRL